MEESRSKQMGIMDFVKGSTKELAIARPDDAKGRLIYKHPDTTIPNKAQLTVGMDEIAFFYKDGQFVGKIEAGRHTLESGNIPFLSRIVDSFTGGNLFKAEIWFVSTREMAGPDYRFGGRIGDVEDPKTKLAIQLMVHGDYSLQVTDPALLIQFYGQRANALDSEFLGFFRQRFLMTMREAIADLLAQRQLPLLDVTSGKLSSEIEQAVIKKANETLTTAYGVKIIRMGNYVVSMKAEDEATLKSMYKDMAQMQMAGQMQGNLANYQQYAMGKAVMNSGDSGGENPIMTGAGLGMGMMMAQQMMGNQQKAPAQNVAAAPSLEERLLKLKQLKEKGLIDDKEYDERKKEILKDI